MYLFSLPGGLLRNSHSRAQELFVNTMLGMLGMLGILGMLGMFTGTCHGYARHW